MYSVKTEINNLVKKKIRQAIKIKRNNFKTMIEIFFMYIKIIA